MPRVAPFIPTPVELVYEALSFAKVGPCDILFDLGCGDGRVLVIAARDFGVKRAVGVEIDDALATIARLRAEEEGVADRVEVIEGDFFEVSVRGATVVYLYLYMSINEALASKLEKELEPGARVVTLDFPIPQWTPVRIRRVEDREGRIRSIHLYVVGVSNVSEISVSDASRLKFFTMRLSPCETLLKETRCVKGNTRA